MQATYLAAPFPAILELLASSRQRHYFLVGRESKVMSGSRSTKRKGGLQLTSTWQQCGLP